MRLSTITAMFVLAPLALAAARLDVLDVKAPSMDKTFKCSVLLPDAYDQSGKEIPVVYLLHGSNGTTGISLPDWSYASGRQRK